MRSKCIHSCRILKVHLHADSHHMEPTEAQYLVLNALETLELLEGMLYDEERGFYLISTLSSILPIALVLQDGEIIPTSWATDI
ncbi:hypothetical protein NIES4105_59950 [Calothrix sp. NIES-4105]|nr:hypothetical protein NIES4105_59950 [Calothrix sp. NIES-4105]